jgi:hypothetical protein
MRKWKLIVFLYLSFEDFKLEELDTHFHLWGVRSRNQGYTCVCAWSYGWSSSSLSMSAAQYYTIASICTSMQPWGHLIISGSKELTSPCQACSLTAHMVTPENERKKRANYVAPYTYRDTVALTRGACTTILAKRKSCPSSPEPEKKKPFIAFWGYNLLPNNGRL